MTDVLRIEPLTAARWQDVVAVFGTLDAPLAAVGGADRDADTVPPQPAGPGVRRFSGR